MGSAGSGGPSTALVPIIWASGGTAEDAADVEAVQPGNLLDAAQGEPDDLTQISGVGKVLEQKLHDNGVFHFWQIAQWGPEEIAWMDDKLSFKGRIERDGWIAQAADLAAGKETEFAKRAKNDGKDED